jgi:hypothetical protein
MKDVQSTYSIKVLTTFLKKITPFFTHVLIIKLPGTSWGSPSFFPF